MLGIPVVGMEGAEPHARTDGLIIRRLGLPGWLIATNREEYMRAALRLIDDSETRAAVSAAALAADPADRFFGRGDNGFGGAVSDAVWAAYQMHGTPTILESKVWPLAKLLERLPRPEQG